MRSIWRRSATNLLDAELDSEHKATLTILSSESIPTRTTAQKALRELLDTGTIERTGLGERGDPRGDPYRYFAPKE
jgi:predicted transcriptional regulator